MKRLIAVGAFAGLIAVAGDKQTEASKAPALTETQLKSYWRLRALSAEIELQLSSVYLEMGKACGEKFRLALSPQTGEPICAPANLDSASKPIAPIR